MVKTLLVNGADPTETFDGRSIWERHLERLDAQFEHALRSNKGGFTDSEKAAWYQTTELLIIHGSVKKDFKLGRTRTDG